MSEPLERRSRAAFRAPSRRGVLAGAAASGLAGALGLGLGMFGARAAGGTLRIASVKFGSLAWLLETIKAEGLDRKHNVAIEIVETATNQSSPVTLYGGSADIVVSDWPWALRQRAQGEALRFAPFSAALGSIMVPDASPIRSLPDLEGRRLGVAGSSSDKSWLILRAYARRTLGKDIADIVIPQFGAAPLLNEQLKDGRLDAVLNFWTFAARLEAQGFRTVLSMSEVLDGLGIAPQPALVGYIWKVDAERASQAEIDAFLTAAGEANELLSQDDRAWERLRPMMRAGDEKEFTLLRASYRSGIRGPWSAADMASARKIMNILLEGGDTDLAKHGTRFDPDLFYAPRA